MILKRVKLETKEKLEAIKETVEWYLSNE